jgi:hypothetical protein
MNRVEFKKWKSMARGDMGIRKIIMQVGGQGMALILLLFV